MTAAPASGASATHDVLACTVIRVTLVTEGLAHCTCLHGKSVHVSTVTPWTPRPVEQPGDQPCLRCHRPLPQGRHTNTRYHETCSQARETQRLAERKRQEKAARQAVEA